MRFVSRFFLSKNSLKEESLRNLIFLNLIFAVIYFLLARLGLTLASLNHSVSPVWPATGFAFSIVYFFGNRALWSVGIGAFAANSMTGGVLLSTFAISLGNTLEAWVGASIIRYILSHQKKIGPQAEPIAMVASSFLASICSASVGVIALHLTGNLSRDLMAPVWVTWWIGDSLGGLVFAPLLIKFFEFSREIRNWRLLAGVIGLTAMTTFFVFFSGNGGSFLFLLFPVLLLAALFFEALLVMAISAIVCAFGIYATVQGVGPFAIGDFNERLIHLQLFLASYAVTAMVLSAFGRRNLNRIVCLVLVFCWGLAGSIFYSFDRSEAQRTEEHFNNLISVAQEKIQLLATSYEDVLRGGVGLHLASSSVEYSQWKEYNKAVDITRNHTGMNGLGVIWSVKPKEMKSFENKVRAQGLPGFKIKAVPGNNDFYQSKDLLRYVIIFVEPMERNLAAFGLDVGSEINRREAAERSRDIGAGVMSSKIILVQDDQKTPGSLFFFPVYDKRMKTETIEERRKAHLGWVYAPIIYRNFFLEMFTQTGDELELQVFEGLQPSANSLIFSNFSNSKLGKQTVRENKLQIGSRDFTLRWQKSPRFVSSHNTVVAWVGLCGALATLLLGHLMIAIQMVGYRSREIAEELTKELSQSREKFKEGERRLLYALDGSNDGIWDWNIQKSEMYVSGRIAEKHGWPQTFQVKSARDLEPYAHPEDLNAIDKSIGNILRGRTESHEVETRYRTIDRDWRWVLTRGKISERDSNGKALRMTGVHIDIHDLKIAQQRLESTQYQLANIANSVPTKISLWSKDLICEFANDPFSKWLGVETSQVVGRSMQDILDPVGFTELQDVIQRALEGHAFSHEREFVHPTNQQKSHAVVSYLPSVNQGAIEGFYLFIQDITDLKQAELKAIEDRKIALDATKVKSQFLANMSHEIRTPLNGIIGMNKLLSMTELNSKQKEYSNLIRQSSEGLLSLINDILDFSKIEAGKFELEEVHFNLPELISSLMKSLSFSAQEKNLKFEMDLKLASHEHFRGDPGRIRQILTNLISNAIKFTEHGKVSLRVIGYDRGDRTHLNFEVEDSGIGIPAEALQRMFKAFSQADPSTTRKYGGTGLGLSICKELVQMMGGDIGVESELKKGSKFWFHLDLLNGSEVKTAVPSDTQEANREARILIAEDNLINQQIAIELLEHLGYAPQAVSTGIDVLNLITRNRYDLILMDCQMHDMDGFEATRRIRQFPDARISSIPIIALTANALKGDREKCIEAGMNDYLTKPIDAEILEQKLRKWLSQEKIDYGKGET